MRERPHTHKRRGFNLRELKLAKNWPGDDFFRLGKSKFGARQFSQYGLFKYLTFLYLSTYFFISSSWEYLLQEHRCKIKIDKLNNLKRSTEQRIILPEMIIICCILKKIFKACKKKVGASSRYGSQKQPPEVFFKKRCS